MERAEDELERIMYRDAPPRKRVREAVSYSSSSSSSSNTSDDESELDFPVPDEPPPPSPKPLLATMSSGKQVVVPRPNLPIALHDVIEFLHHFKIFKGLISGDFDRSQGAMLAVLTKWNSVYTIAQDPHMASAEAIGEKAGNNLALRCIITKQERLLRPLHGYFDNLDLQAEKNLRDMTGKDMDEYAEYGPLSWYHMQAMQRRFARSVKAAIVQISRKEQAKREEEKQAAKLLAEIEATKAIENRGGIVFGSGGGARGGYDFNMEIQVTDEFTFKPYEGGELGEIEFDLDGTA